MKYFMAILLKHEADQFHGVPGFELAHDVGAMEFRRARADPELACRLLVRCALHDLGEHDPFARVSRSCPGNTLFPGAFAGGWVQAMEIGIFSLAGGSRRHDHFESKKRGAAGAAVR